MIDVTIVFTATNVAVGKASSQSSTSSGGVSGRAVDGNPNANWAGSSCTHTDSETNPWWVVDLGESYDISKVVIYNRNPNGMCELWHYICGDVPILFTQ
jgi:hypothetical protein